MNQHQHQQHSAAEHAAFIARKNENHWRLALSATLHCLLGCGLGEVLGMSIGTWLHWDNLPTMILAIVLGFVLGFALGMLPLLRAGFGFKRAFRQVLVAEGLSIAVMEAVELWVQVSTPGVMDAHLGDWIYWRGMGLGLLAGFIAAYPINYLFIRKGVRHYH